MIKFLQIKYTFISMVYALKTVYMLLSSYELYENFHKFLWIFDTEFYLWSIRHCYRYNPSIDFNKFPLEIFYFTVYLQVYCKIFDSYYGSLDGNFTKQRGISIFFGFFSRICPITYNILSNLKAYITCNLNCIIVNTKHHSYFHNVTNLRSNVLVWLIWSHVKPFIHPVLRFLLFVYNFFKEWCVLTWYWYNICNIQWF